MTESFRCGELGRRGEPPGAGEGTSSLCPKYPKEQKVVPFKEVSSIFKSADSMLVSQTTRRLKTAFRVTNTSLKSTLKTTMDFIETTYLKGGSIVFKSNGIKTRLT